MADADMQLSDEQVTGFRTNGYLSLDALVPLAEVETMRGAFDRIFATRAGRGEGNHFDLAGADEEGTEPCLPQILGPEQYAPELADGLFWTRATAIARQLLGTDELSIASHAIVKPPGIGAATPPHQDEAYWDPGQEHNGISVWMPLQNATLDNGCMLFAPGSHTQDVLPHRSIGGDVRVHGLEIEPGATNLDNLVACPIPAGGVTIHHCRTLHCAGPNRTAEMRRAYILVFNAPARPLMAPRNFYWQQARRTRAAELRAKAAVTT